MARAAQAECRGGSDLNDPVAIMGLADPVRVGLINPSPDPTGTGTFGRACCTAHY